jgi:putative membrane protein
VPSPDETGTGSGTDPDARFSLANERTFLAYERTAIGLLVAGTGALHLLDGGRATVLGLVLLATAVLAAVGGWLRFRSVERAMRAGGPLPASPLPHLVVAGVVLCVVAVALTAPW